MWSKGPSWKGGKRKIRNYPWIGHEGVWTYFHAQRNCMILSRRLLRFAAPVTANLHACYCNSSTPSLEQFQSTTTSFITLQQQVTEVGNRLETFHPIWSGGGNSWTQCPAELDSLPGSATTLSGQFATVSQAFHTCQRYISLLCEMLWLLQLKFMS